MACQTGTEDFGNSGTTYYMAPEQIEGDAVDPRTDIYALGITAYEMVTGRKPFPEGDAKTLLNMHLNQDIPDPKKIVPDLPEPLRAFIRKACRRDPNQRYRDAGHALEVFRPLVKDLKLTRKNLSFEKRKMSTFCLIYKDEHQLALNRLMDDFSAKARRLGVELKLADFRDI